MRFWVVIGCVAALGCGGSVRHNQSPGAGGSSAGSSGAISSAGAGGTSGAAVTGGGPSRGGNGGLHDGGSVPITPEQRQELVNAACTGTELVTHAIDAAIELVVGADVSMSLPAPGSAESRWTVTSNAVRQSFDVWPEYSEVGLVVHPNLGPDGATPSISPQDPQACVNLDAIVPADRLRPAGSAQRELIEASLAAVSLGPGRPLGDAYQRAFEDLFESLSVQFVVLFVDGPPTLAQQCTNPTGSLSAVDTAELVGQIAAAANDYVRTYVIGLPGSESIREALSLAAVAGGTAPDCAADEVCHLDLSATQDLASALESTLTQIATEIALRLTPTLACTLTVPSPPAGRTLDKSKVSVLIGPNTSETRLFLLDEIGDCTEGWRWISESELELCPATCEIFYERNAQLEIFLGCTPCSSVDC